MAKRRIHSRYLYGLLDPDSGEVRYVGLAVDPDARMRAHERAFGPLGDWVRGLIAAGKYAVMCLMLELARPEVSGFPRIGPHSPLPSFVAEAMERFVIEHFHDHYSAELFNVAKKPATPKRKHARAEGIVVDGSDVDSWLPKFKAAFAAVEVT